MSGFSNNLLPQGLRDLLFPETIQEETIVRKILDSFEQFGYNKVDPPIIEFENTLKSGLGRFGAHNIFTLMDPVSQKILGLRTDITPQVARIATSRLSNEPRPLRLSYSGEIFRVTTNQLKPERQLFQIGAELIGAPNIHSDLEILYMTASTIEKLEIDSITIDINFPSLVQNLINEEELDHDHKKEVSTALSNKNLSKLNNKLKTVFEPFMDLTGPVNNISKKLKNIKLSARSKDILFKGINTATLLQSKCPQISVTIDVTENRGFNYYAGIGFTVFAINLNKELGFGGHYILENGENATGVSLMVDSFMKITKNAPKSKLVYIPFGIDWTKTSNLRKKGYKVLHGLEPEKHLLKEAKRLKCSHILQDKKIVCLSKENIK